MGRDFGKETCPTNWGRRGRLLPTQNVLDSIVVYKYTNTMRRTKAHDYLRELGLNQLEVEVYIFLLPQPPTTAYRIAKSLGKPAANVYKAVESLSRRGALIVEDGPSRLCRPVPARVFLKRAVTTFNEISLAAEVALADTEFAPIDEHVYRVETVEQIYVHCREMIEKAKAVAVIDAFPIPLDRMRPWVEKAARRGVEVFVEAYEPIALGKARVTLIPVADSIVRQWNAQQLNLVIDGEESLMALLTKDGTGVLQAYWSNSLYLSCLHHGGRLCEQTLVRALEARRNGASPEEVMAVLESHPFFMNKSVPGQKKLIRRYSTTKEQK